MRAERLLSILLLLQVHRRMTARELAERLEVAPRTIQRDMDALSAAGIPLYAERGPRGGWVLPEEYRDRPAGLSETEIQALVLARSTRAVTDLGLEPAANAALLKLMATLPAVRRQAAAEMRERIYLDPAGWRQSAGPGPTLPVVQEAIWQDRLLAITYRRADGETSERLIGPLGLVAKANAWYLVGSEGDQIKSFRVSRIESAAPTDQPFARPPDFDLVAYWTASNEQFMADLPRYPTVLRIRGEQIPRLWFLWRFARVGKPQEPAREGWVTVPVQFQLADEAAAHVLSLGPDVEIVEPPELRERVLATARAVIERYSPHPAPSAPSSPNPGRGVAAQRPG